MVLYVTLSYHLIINIDCALRSEPTLNITHERRGQADMEGEIFEYLLRLVQLPDGANLLFISTTRPGTASSVARPLQSAYSCSIVKSLS